MSRAECLLPVVALLVLLTAMYSASGVDAPSPPPCAPIGPCATGTSRGERTLSSLSSSSWAVPGTESSPEPLTTDGDRVAGRAGGDAGRPVEGSTTAAASGRGGAAGGGRSIQCGCRCLRASTGGSATVSELHLGLEWLKRAQEEDGSWGARPARTGLALLAFLGAGETHRYGRYKKTVKAALKHLKQIQDVQGWFGAAPAAAWADDHAIATLAMAEAYGLTGSPLFKRSAQAAVSRLVAEPHPDTQVSLWRILATRSANVAGLAIPEDEEEAAREWLVEITDQEGFAWTGRGGFPPDSVRGATAAACLCRILLGEDPEQSATLRVAADRILEVLPGEERPTDHAARYFGTLATYQLGRDTWKTWYGPLRTNLLEAQVQEGEESGSWDPVGVSGDTLGRVGTTALATMCLEVYYRYGRVFGAK